MNNAPSNRNTGAPKRPPQQGRPAPKPPVGGPPPQKRPDGRPGSPQRPSAYRRAPEDSPRTAPPRQRPAYNSYSNSRRGESDFLVICLVVLSILLALTVTAFILVKLDVFSGGNETPDETDPKESVQAGVNDPNESESAGKDDPDNPALPSWQVQTDDPKAFIPQSTDSSVNLSNSEINAQHAIMVELKTHKVICQYKPDEKMYPASMTKVMTAIVACELIEDMFDTFTLTVDILNPLYNEGASMAYFKTDSKIPYIDLLYGALLPSGADATAGLAIGLCGSEEEFVKLMNKKALEMGCYGTHFTNASGLHNEEHYSTARDMAAIMAYAADIPLLKAIMSTKSYKPFSYVDTADGYMYCTWSARLHGRESRVATMFAAKTGYTPEALQCLVSISRASDGKEYVIVTAGGSTTAQTDGKYAPYLDAKHLCDTYIK